MINGLLSHGTKVYSYDLTYEGMHSYTNLLGLPHLGVCHGDELIYMWHPISHLGLVLTGEQLTSPNPFYLPVLMKRKTFWWNISSSRPGQTLPSTGTPRHRALNSTGLLLITRLRIRRINGISTSPVTTPVAWTAVRTPSADSHSGTICSATKTILTSLFNLLNILTM